MDIKLATEKYRSSQWMEIIRDRKESGLRVEDFCLEKGISKHAYYYWQRKLRKAACTELAKQDGMSTAVPVGWVQLAPATATVERGRFKWPAEGDSLTMTLHVRELSYLIEGAKLEKKLKREEVLERQIS
jgi:hypothetical protein